MPKKKAAPLKVPASNPALVKVRTDGIRLVSPLQADVETLTIQNEEEYLQADFMLARIKAAVATWDTKIRPVLDPLERALQAQKEAMAGAKALDDEVRKPLKALEETVKGSMKTFKLEEAAAERERKAAADRESARLLEEANRKEQQAKLTKSPLLRARLEQAKTDLQAAAEVVEREAVVEPVRGVASTTRAVKKVIITDVLAFLDALQAYQPRTGLYELEHPPLTLLTHEIQRDGSMLLVVQPFTADSAMWKVQTELMKIYRTQPGVVASWPGVEVIDDIIIANR